MRKHDSTTYQRERTGRGSTEVTRERILTFIGKLICILIGRVWISPSISRWIGLMTPSYRVIVIHFIIKSIYVCMPTLIYAQSNLLFTYAISQPKEISLIKILPRCGEVGGLLPLALRKLTSDVGA